jgi:hypothetical protein
MLADLTSDGYVASETILRGIVACMKLSPTRSLQRLRAGGIRSGVGRLGPPASPSFAVKC